MALIKAALLPHSPLLIPEIGRANYSFLEKTVTAYQTIADSLEQNELETLIVISPHGPSQAQAFNINVAPEMKINLKNFGFIPPNASLSGDIVLADKIKNECNNNGNIQMSSEAELDHGSAIPIYLLGKEKNNFKVIVISPAKELSLEEQLKFGQQLMKTIQSSPRRIAVIASGDLSHRLAKKSPGGYSPKGAKFDNKIIEYLSEASSAKERIINMDQNLIEAAGECGLKSIAILLGVLDQLDWQAKFLAYQNDFGVGYLSMNFNYA